MVNIEHKLTVDDLIVEYMMYKVRNGYEPSFLTAEFISFLYFFESKMSVEDSLYENDKLFQRFFARKEENDWSIVVSGKKNIKEILPHMDMVYSDLDNDYLIKANYKLSEYDRSVINTYFMDGGMGRYADFKGKTYEIRNIIKNYLLDQPKRIIDESIKIDKNDLIVGKYVAAEIVINIWECYIWRLIKNGEWPKQCTDINKYLFDTDLAQIIGVKSIKNELINLYNDFSKRIAILYCQDRSLRISTSSNVYLARANYDLLIQGYEEIMKTTFSEYNKSFDVDLASLTFKGSYEVDGVYYWDEDVLVKTTTNVIGNENVKKLVRSLKNIEER